MARSGKLVGRESVIASKLPKFQGRPVIEMKVAFRKAGDGLSAQLSVDPVPHEAGDTVFHIVRSVVGPINHRPRTLTAAAPFTRIEDYIVQEVVEVDGDDVGAYLDTAREQLETARQEAEQVELAGGQGKQQTIVETPPADDENEPDAE